MKIKCISKDQFLNFIEDESWIDNNWVIILDNFALLLLEQAGDVEKLNKIKNNEHYYIMDKFSFQPWPQRYHLKKGITFDLFFQEFKNYLNLLKEQNVSELYIECVAGIHRSAAFGVILNEYFNHFLMNNEDDFNSFIVDNSEISPNSLLKKLIKIIRIPLFGEDYPPIQFNGLTF